MTSPSSAPAVDAPSSCSKCSRGCFGGLLRLLHLVPGPTLMQHAFPAPPTPDDADAEKVSKRKQRKQLWKESQPDRNLRKKVLKQEEALEAALTALCKALATDRRTDTRAARPSLLEEAFGRPECSYGALPLCVGPRADSEGIEILAKVLCRPPKYNAKFSAQEYSLLHKVWALLGGDCRGAGVLDVGAGNANCAVLASTLLGLTVVCVERESPRVELRAEAQLPESLQQGVIRVESDIADFGPQELARLAAQHSLQRFVVVAKHPCGVGADRTIDFAAKLSEKTKERSGPLLVGAVIATCCTNKLSIDDLNEPRAAEFCGLYSQDLLASQLDPKALEKAVEVMSRCSAWRSASGSEGNAISQEQVRWAELFEDHVQALRLRRLKRIFGDSAEVRFAPRACTLQDRCLLASQALPADLFTSGAASESSFLLQLRSGASKLLQELGGPIDCRPKGLRSARYDFDYTEE